jgi:LAO/AO transport system kinase
LIEAARSGHPRAIARLITQVENHPALAQEVVRSLHAATGRAYLVGITGPPGSGKSSLVNELAKALRHQGQLVAILAVDPSSPFTGGAILGDRVRMRDLAGDEGIFVRSMASRGSLGGLAQGTTAALKVLDAAGFHTILVETVGAGQIEVDVASATHTTLVVEAPGMGDEIQSIKAGILEIADILVVNKADRPEAKRTVKLLEMAMHFNAAADGWAVPVLATTAVSGEGVAALVDALLAHKVHLEQSGEWTRREKRRSRRELEQLLTHRLLARLEQAIPAAEREQVLAAVVERKMDPYTAVETLLTRMKDEG